MHISKSVDIYIYLFIYSSSKEIIWKIIAAWITFFLKKKEKGQLAEDIISTAFEDSERKRKVHNIIIFRGNLW